MRFMKPATSKRWKLWPRAGRVLMGMTLLLTLAMTIQRCSSEAAGAKTLKKLVDNSGIRHTHDAIDRCPESLHEAMGGPFEPEFVHGYTTRMLFSDRAEAAGQELRALSPVHDARVTSTFGKRQDPLGKGKAFHGGIDFAAPLGSPILAAASGTVIQANFQHDYGNVVKVDHGNGHITVYAHSQRLLVKSGQRVNSGQKIALLGSTGRSTGPHLHFEVRVSGVRVDPRRFLRFEIVSA